MYTVGAMSIKKNKQFYNNFWSRARLFSPEHWAHWAVVNSQKINKALEIGPGNKPKIPVKGNFFVDVSKPCLDCLEKLGGRGFLSDLTAPLPFGDGQFDLVCCFEVLEHLENDNFVIGEVYRVLQGGGRFLLSVPIGMNHWSKFDEHVGHVRRYEPKSIVDAITAAGFSLKSYSLLDMPWPGKYSSAFYVPLIRLFPFMYVWFTDLIDLTPLSYMKRPFVFKNGNEVNNTKPKDSTLILICEKL